MLKKIIKSIVFVFYLCITVVFVLSLHYILPIYWKLFGTFLFILLCFFVGVFSGIFED